MRRSRPHRWITVSLVATVIAATVAGAGVLWTALDEPGSAGEAGGSTGAMTAPRDGRSSTGPTRPSGPTGLDPGLQRAFAAAVSAADDAGHALTLTSGYRTVDEQEQLLGEAVVEHGSEEAALRWVFPPERSMHVQGLAVDVGDGPAADWLDQHGARLGLCRTLAWEWWHFEWRAAWEEAGTCPRPVDEPQDAPGRDVRGVQGS